LIAFCRLEARTRFQVNMSDSFYWLNGEKLYFSSGATELLYGILVCLGNLKLIHA